MKRIPRDPMRFDIFDVFAEAGKLKNISLRNPIAAEDFVGKARASIEMSLTSDTFLQGLRTEAMFGALVASLGSVQLLKEEDAGEIYAADDTLKPADFRLVLADGKQILVEVKNFYQGESHAKGYSMADAYFQGLNRYAKAMGCDLKLAIYWVQWNIWTLVSPSTFKQHANKWVLEMTEAFRTNEMSILGDVLVGTRFPLELKLVADPTKPRTIDQHGVASFTIGAVEMFCAGSKITDPVERSIAGFLMMYGDWLYEGPQWQINKNQVEAALHRWWPEEDHKQGFEIVGGLSNMFSRFYRQATSSDEGKVEQLKVDVSPGFLGVLIPADYEGKALPLWRLIIQQAR